MNGRNSNEGKLQCNRNVEICGYVFAIVIETVMIERCQHTESNWSDGWHRGWICIINVEQSL